MPIPDARLVSNIHLWLILHLDPQPLVVHIFASHARRNLLLLVMELRDSALKLFHISLFLWPETVDPNILWLLIVSQNIRPLVSKVLLSQLERPFNLNLFHAAILWHSLDVGSGHINPLEGVQLGLGAPHLVLLAPFVADVDHCLWFGLK